MNIRAISKTLAILAVACAALAFSTVPMPFGTSGHKICFLDTSCAFSGSVLTLQGLNLGPNQSARLTASASLSPPCGYVSPGSGVSKTTVTMPTAIAGCHEYIAPGLQNVLVDFGSQVARIPCYGGHDITKLFVPFALENSYLDFGFDSTQWNMDGGSTLQAEAICPGDDQLLTNGQVQFNWNGSQFQLLQKNGPGGLIIHSQMHVVPSAGLLMGTTGVSASTLYYVYAAEVGADPVSGTSNPSGSTIRLTFSTTVPINAADQGFVNCHSIWGTLAANGPHPIAFVDTTHGDLIGPVYDSAFVASGTPLCRVVYLFFSTTGHHTFNGIETKSDDNNSTLVGMFWADAGSAINDSATKRYVAGWYNRKLKTCINKYTADRTTTSTTYAELNTEIECGFVTWGDNDAAWKINGTGNNATVGDGYMATAGFDGTTPETEEGGSVNSQASSGLFVGGSKSGLSEGKHYITLLGKVVTGGTMTAFGTTPVTSAEISVQQ